MISFFTTGMQSCILSSPDQPVFTAQNASNTSVAGAAETEAVTTSARFLLHCETVAGSVRDATTTVSVGATGGRVRAYAAETRRRSIADALSTAAAC